MFSRAIIVSVIGSTSARFGLILKGQAAPFESAARVFCGCLKKSMPRLQSVTRQARFCHKPNLIVHLHNNHLWGK